jgi:hypothetical protein
VITCVQSQAESAMSHDTLKRNIGDCTDTCNIYLVIFIHGVSRQTENIGRRSRTSQKEDVRL